MTCLAGSGGQTRVVATCGVTYNYCTDDDTTNVFIGLHFIMIFFI